MQDISESNRNNFNSNNIEKAQLLENDNKIKDLEKIEECNNNHEDNAYKNNDNSMKKNSSLIEKSDEEIENKSYNDKIVRK